MRMTTRVRLAAIPFADEALRDLGTFTFIMSHIFSVGGHHLSDVSKLLRLIGRLEEIQTEVKRVISPPYLSMELLYDMPRQRSQCLNRCMAASSSKVAEVPGASDPFSLELILVDLEGGRYIDPILPILLADLVVGRRSAGGNASRSGSGGGIKKVTPKVDATGDLHECKHAMKCT